MFSLQCQKFKNNFQLFLKRAETSVVLIYINRVPEKLYSINDLIWPYLLVCKTKRFQDKFEQADDPDKNKNNYIKTEQNIESFENTKLGKTGCESRIYVHTLFEYEFRTPTPKLLNLKMINTKYIVLIGRLSSMSKIFFITATSQFSILLFMILQLKLYGINTKGKTILKFDILKNTLPISICFPCKFS